MRDEGGGEAEASFKGVAHYLKIRSLLATGRWGVWGSWVVTVYVFMPYCTGKRFEEIGK